jgi:hypothetical protein
MNLAQLLALYQGQRADANARLDALTTLVATEARGFTPEEQAEFATLEATVSALVGDEARVQARLDAAAANAQPVIAVSQSVQAARAAAPVRAAAQAPAIIRARSHSDAFEGQTYTRSIIAQAVARMEGVSAMDVARARWGAQAASVEHLLQKRYAASVPGGSTTTYMAEMLDIDSEQDFITFLRSKTIFDRLNLRPLAPYVTVGGQDAAGTAFWVGEGRGIGVNALSLLTVSLTPLKLGAIKAVTKESLRINSTLQERVIRDDLIESAVQLIDGRFFSATAGGTGVSPAGIFYNLAALDSAGNDWQGVVADVNQLVATFVAAKNVNNLSLVMNPAMALTIGSLRGVMGNKMFPDIRIDGGTLENIPVLTGDNVGASVIALVKQDEIYSVEVAGPQLEISTTDQATIEMNDTPLANLNDSTAGTANPISMFQTESVAFKMVRPVNWAKRRAHAVAWIDDADYTPTPAT